MKYVKCGHEAIKGTITESIELEFGLLVIRNIPCYKCTECGVISYTGTVTQRIEELVERAMKKRKGVSLWLEDYRSNLFCQTGERSGLRSEKSTT